MKYDKFRTSRDEGQKLLTDTQAADIRAEYS